jgi:molybdopterin-guanine dinucleotide biosynthesis protein A
MFVAVNTSAGWAAIVLAGGAARRLGGVEKPLLTIEGTALLTRVLAAVPDARPRIVAGPPALRPALSDDAVLVQEDPPGAGPVAAIRAAIGLVPPTVAVTAVLAGDLPFVTPSVLSRLRDALGESDVALLTDADGRRQNLLGVWRTERLRAALSQTASAAVRDLLDRLTVIAVPPGAGRPWLDCDTPEDLDLARRIAGQKPSDSSSAWTADR